MNLRLLFFSLIICFVWPLSISDASGQQAVREAEVTDTEINPSIGRAPFKSLSINPGEHQIGLSGNTIGYAWNIFASGSNISEGSVFIDLGNAAITTIQAVDSETIWMSGADFADDVWYAVNHDDNNSGLYTINRTTGEYQLIGLTGYTMTGLAFDPVSNTMYGSGFDGTTSSLYIVDLATGQATLVGEILNSVIIGLAGDAFGNLYGINLSDNSLYSVNTTTGNGVRIGGLGTVINYAQDIAFDRDNNILYGTLFGATGGLFTINVETGTATRIGGFPVELGGFAIPYNIPDSGSPAAASEFTATEGPQGALQVTLSWENPTHQVDGAPLTELLSVVVERNGEIIHTISNPSMGAAETFIDNLVSTGINTYSVYGVNATGNGAKSFEVLFVGEDVPAAPGNVTLASQGSDGLLSWNPPSGGLNGGYFNSQNLTYTVTRMPEGLVIAEDISQTEVIDNRIPSPAYYYYIVIPSNAAGTGGSAASNAVLLNSERVLLYEPFDYTPGELPDGWQLTGDVVHNWRVNDAFFAGGDAPELRMHWATPSNTGMSRVVSAPISTQGFQNIRFSYKMFLDSYTPNEGDIVAIDISFDNGQSWDDLWEDFIKGDLGPDDFELYFDVPEGKSSFLIGFRFDGKSSNITQWCFDNLLLRGVAENDLLAYSLNGKKYPSTLMPQTYSFEIINTGSHTQDNYTVKLLNQNNDVLDSKEGVSIEAGETLEYIFSWTPDQAAEGPGSLFGYIEYSDDKSSITSPFGVQVLPDNAFSVTIGEEQNTSPGPFFFQTRNSLQQTLYFPHELGVGGGQITGIEYKNHFEADSPDRNIKIWLGETDMSDLSTGWVNPSGLQLVFDGTKDFPQGVNDIFIPFDNHYSYGGKNLVVYIHKEEIETHMSRFFFNSNDPGSKRTRFVRRANPVYNPENPPTASNTVSDLAPNVTMIFNINDLGSIHGVVTDQTTPVDNVIVKILDTQLSAVTDENGYYSFPYLNPGTYSLEFSKNGYEDFLLEDVELCADCQITQDVNMMPFAKYTVGGFVEGNDGYLLDATVTLEGYNNFVVETDSEGVFLIEEVFAGTYSIKVTAEGYTDYYQEDVMVDSNTDLGKIELTEIIVSPGLLSVEVHHDLGSALFSWSGDKKREFRYDDETVSGQVGSSGGTLNTVLGGAYRHDAVLSEMSWYLTAEGGPHNTVKVWVFGLDEQGMPDNTDVLYQMEGVPNEDLRWNTYEFTYPVNAPNGFLVGVSYQGFLSLARDSGMDPQWPFMPLSNFASMNVTNTPFSPIEEQGDFAENFLIRAFGVDNGEIEFDDPETRGTSMQGDFSGKMFESFSAGSPVFNSEVHDSQLSRIFNGFNVYLNGTLEAEEIGAEEYLFQDLQQGTYTAGVQAVYTTGTSEIVEMDFHVNAPPAYMVTFIITDQDDNPIDNAIITFNNQEYNPGVTVFDDVPAGSYPYIISKTGFLDVEGDVTVANQDVEVSIMMASDGVSVPVLAEAEISVFPNPASYSVNIQSSEIITQVRIADVLGNIVFQSDIGADQAALNISGFDNGIYFLQIETVNSLKTSRLQIFK